MRQPSLSTASQHARVAAAGGAGGGGEEEEGAGPNGTQERGQLLLSRSDYKARVMEQP